MTDLIPLRHNNQILARDLHFFIDAKRQFANWINERIENYDFIENQDYIIELVYTKGRPRKEYYVTLDMAKELCMVENNEKGRQARRYFIECEKRLKNLEKEQMQKLAFRQSLGYKSQLAQQKTNFKNQIKALKYDLNQTKDELDICKGALDVLKRRKDFSNEENLRLLQKELAKYGLVIFNELDFALWSENLTKNIIGETKRRLDDLINYNYQILKDKFNKRLNIKETKCYK
ncbi:antA/AntB antirepressor family protein [Campylobacter lari]|uniref:antA/AntB antirepressor family protein n=1 Tax=Campylobacter lari TaxID=201 RepID=UPI0017B89C02|nr:antA/AntB antirepressor family protein [Campylobacter lari]EAH7581123.1 phage antirepressor Ant [Campylobacter lari]EAI5464480.1 phage antirepressor Ant [Campylobacter lari]EAJ1108473.1 phage antirepressor Ant [Campylobacter lari]EGK7501320.1 phage antirepressor Ant [Campylobacter lari]EKL1313736.1 antA/AntB antirepressor family protein [Campylobacter lari]